MKAHANRELTVSSNSYPYPSYRTTCGTTRGYCLEHCDDFFTSLAGFVDTLPDSEKARLTVSVKLLDKKFSNDLTDKSSKKYKELKTTVVEAVSVTFLCCS